MKLGIPRDSWTLLGKSQDHIGSLCHSWNKVSLTRNLGILKKSWTFLGKSQIKLGIPRTSWTFLAKYQDYMYWGSLSDIRYRYWVFLFTWRIPAADMCYVILRKRYTWGNQPYGIYGVSGVLGVQNIQQFFPLCSQVKGFSPHAAGG